LLPPVAKDRRTGQGPFSNAKAARKVKVRLGDLSENSVILCECNGRITGGLNTDDIASFLKRRSPDTEVIVADNLCQPGALQEYAGSRKIRPGVVGACTELENNRHFEKAKAELGCDSYSVRIVDLLAETNAPYSIIERTERAKLLLWAQIRRRSQFQRVPADKLKMQFVKPEGEISRRDLLRLVLPRNTVIPFIEPVKCKADRGCQLCLKACPLNAIIAPDSEAVIDATLCNGCGACVAACPERAVIYPTFSPEEINGELEGLLLPDDVDLGPRIVGVSCQGGLPASGEKEAARPALPANMLPLSIPSLAMVSPWLMLRAFYLGAQGLALITSPDTARRDVDFAQCEENVMFAQQILGCWGIEPQRVRVFTSTDSTIQRELDRFAEEIAGLSRTPMLPAADTPLPARGLMLPAILKNMGERLGEPSGDVATGNVACGTVKLDNSKCTGCGLCTMNCPTGALSFTSNDEGVDLLKITFKHGNCVACGECVEACPENCLTLERSLNPGSVLRAAEVFFEDEIARCRKCGKPIASMAMIRQLRDRLSKSGAATAHLELCPECRSASQFGLKDVRPDRAARVNS